MPPTAKPARKSLRKYQEAADLLPGLKLAASIALNSLNEIRSVLELPPFGLIEEPRPRPVEILKKADPRKTGSTKKRIRKPKKPAAEIERGRRKPAEVQRQNREKLKAIEPAIRG
jgi:hypothetical protein